MKKYVENRANKRKDIALPVVFSYFNKEKCFEAQALNHCPGGVCFKSEVFLKPGAAIFLRVNYFDANNRNSKNHGGIRSVSIAEVKWCSEILDSKVSSYKIGVKYYEPAF